MKLAFFGYAWNRALRPDAYMTELIKGFSQLGVDVDIYLGNEFSGEHGIYGVGDKVSVERLQDFIKLSEYDAAVSFNHSLLMPQTLEALGCRAVSVIVDESNHLFNYTRGDRYDAFGFDIDIVAMSSHLEAEILANVADAAPRLHFQAPATQPMAPADRAELAARPTFPISWIASYLGDLNIDRYLDLISETPDAYEVTGASIAAIERDGDLDTFRNNAPNRVTEFVDKLPWTFDYFEMQMQNIVTNRQRVAVVERLSRHGLALYGNPGWRRLLQASPSVFAAFQPGPGIIDQAGLHKVYNASKISINLPQIHTAPTAIQYRVVDIMASNALLVTKRCEGSDLYRIFGEDCPVPVYDDFDELERICLHYLNNEQDRQALVRRCNALVATGFSFRDRCVDLLRILGVDPSQIVFDGADPPGRIGKVDAQYFKTEHPGML